jgi:uncharacterized membrane protein HdeD (DUF308 family)
LIILNPITGVIALGIIFTAYFFVDSVLNFSLAFSLKPNSGWIMVLINALLSFALGVYSFIALANPIKTLWLVGIVVGISLFFDGLTLLTLSKGAKKE